MATLLCWNIMGRSPQEATFHKVISNIEKIGADIVCLQEVLPSKKKLRAIEELKNYYTARSHKFLWTSNGFNANIILSTFPIKDHGEIEFKDHGLVHHEVIWADIMVDKKKKRIVRIYNCHLESTFVGIKERLEAQKLIFAHAKKFKGPIIICGDMNTTIPQKGFARELMLFRHSVKERSLMINGRYYEKDERFAFEKAIPKGFVDLLGIKKSTWAIPHTNIELFRLKLDWFITKNICASVKLLRYLSSDHRPILAELK